MESIRYGPLPDQEGDLYLPSTSQPPVVCLLHGGFWRMPHGRDQMAAIADNLVSLGFAVWNLGYRRLGAPRSEWPATMDDVAAGIDHLAEIAARRVDLDLERVAVVGHSAGGQLVLHDTSDAIVPIEISRRYARKADAVGDTVQLVELSETGLMGFVDPSGEAHGALSGWLSVSVGP